MDTKNYYHYVYRITNKLTKKHYYGKRTSTVKPKKDLGVCYFSSSKDKEFIKDQKENPTSYKYKIVGVYSSSEKALEIEIRLHNVFDVGVNDNFYNLSKQTTCKFDTTGTKLSKEHKNSISKTLKGFKHTKESKYNMSKAQKGRVITPEHKDKIRKANSGSNNVNHKLASVYDYSSNNLIAKDVIIEEWSKINGYNAGHLRATALTRLNGSSGKTKRFQHKGIYAVYYS